MRLPSLFVGIIFGYFIDNFEKNQQKFFSRKIQIFFWFNTFLLILSPFTTILFNARHKIEMLKEPSYFISTFVGFYNKIIFAVGTSWIITACHFGKMEFLNKFLSKEFWKPLGKLSLSIYLVHPLIIIRIFLENNPPISDFSNLNIVSIFKLIFLK